MKPNEKHLSAAYLWLFTAGMDHEVVNVEGQRLSQSLAEAFAQFEDDGRQAAIDESRTASGMRPRLSIIDDDEVDTDVYRASDLKRLVAKSRPPRAL